MIQNLEQYRSRRTEVKPMTIGANALDLDFAVASKPRLQVVNSIIEFPEPDLKVTQNQRLSTPDEIFCSGRYIAPKAGERAIEMQSQGLARKSRNLEEYARTGEYTPDVARSSYNAFMRMAVTTENGNVLNISGATKLPEGVNPNDILERIGRKTIGAEVKEAARYGRISIMVADVDAVDFAQLFLNFTEETKAVNSEYFPEEKAKVLNSLQDKRAAELLADVDRAKGVVEGTVSPDIAAMDPSAAKKEYFIWGGKREEGKIKGINPDGDWQDIEELIQAPDLVTKGLVAHEISLLRSAQKRKFRIIFIGDNEAHVPDCCGSVSETQQEMKTKAGLGTEMRESSIKPVDISENPLLSGDDVLYSRGSGRVTAGGGYIDNENCSACGKERNKEDGCRCSAKH